MLNKLRKRTEGFTIIEVLIVLAIAGLILLIIFLAVPALQRNSRNTTLKNDASAVGGGISEFISINNGTSPDDLQQNDEQILLKKSGKTDAEAKVNGSSDVALWTGTVVPVSGDLDASQIRVWFGHKCNGDVSSRASAVFYATERNTGDPAIGCVDA
jgi:prepilin-type N-terminal cleavage/methylation domain-containing protein